MAAGPLACYSTSMPIVEPSLLDIPSAVAHSVSRETLERLQVYVALLHRWTRAINLISSADQDQIWTRHVQDSLRLAPLIPATADRGIDLGSGGGLPGLVLAIATGLPFDLIESDRRKATFLQEAARATGAPARVHCARIEAASVPPAPLVTARALAPLPRLLSLAAPLLQPGGVCLFAKGSQAEQEVAEASGTWRMRVERFPAAGQSGSVTLRISELAHA